MARTKTIVIVLTCCVLPTQHISAQDSPQGVHPRAVSESAQRVVFDNTAFSSGPATALPQWGNGYLISRDVETFQAGVPNVRVYDQSGKKVREAAIWFPQSQRVLIYSATATEDGRILAAGSAEKSDGSASPFIALTDLAGQVTEVIQTGSFAPANICQAPDGTIWSFGGTGYDEHSQPNYGDTLRHFDFQKGELGSYLPRSGFPKHPGPEVLAYIQCSATGVVAYSSKAWKYVEMKYGGDVPHVYQVEGPSGVRLIGFTFTNNVAYGHFSNKGHHGLYYLSLNETTKTAVWVAVDGTVGDYTKPGVITGLWGSDGDKLLVSRAEDRASSVAIHWITPLQ